MPEWVDSGLATAKPYWPFLVQVLVFWFLGQNLKKRVWTKERAHAKHGEGFLFWARRTMWMHPMIVGVGWGLAYPWMPAVEQVASRGGAITQGLLAGVVSIAGYRLLEALAEARKWTAILKFLRSAGDPASMLPPAPKDP